VDSASPLQVGFDDVDGRPELVTALLTDMPCGKKEAMSHPIAIVSPERGIAGQCVRSDRPHLTVQTTRLIDDGCARRFSSERIDRKNRARFFAAVANEISRIRVDYPRSTYTPRGPGEQRLISLSDVTDAGTILDDLPALDRALTRLGAAAACQPHRHNLRFFNGFDERDKSKRFRSRCQRSSATGRSPRSGCSMKCPRPPARRFHVRDLSFRAA
jgi:hypothetical protein